MRPSPAAEPDRTVRAWAEPMVIPTYPAEAPDPDPIFFEGESYQGAQKRVYPYPLQDRLTHERVDKTYQALRLENEYVKLIVLPEIGGRLFEAVDKTNGYDFFYRQHVIKPALIGMLGAWISGGVEWCAFHHHRNTTFMTVDHAIIDNPDGSSTIWFGETERRQRMKWLVGLTLHPNRSVIETTVKLFNRTAQPHSILYWTNAAVPVNNDYQVIFPPSVQVATHHSKISFVNWPIGQGRYMGRDYTGVDVSWWKNSPGANSFFAWNLHEDFMGGYDHGREAGVIQVADHHTVPGAKLWEWGCGTIGELWDKILTDTDGPYSELMTGAWSDNQPDYSWMRPYAVRVIKQFWYPVRGIGGFRNANIEGAVNLDVSSEGVATIAFHATTEHSAARVTLSSGVRPLFDRTIDISPDSPFRQEVALPRGARPTDLRAALFDADGRELIAYQPVELPVVKELPAVVKPPPKPEDLDNLEELYFTGLHIEQIHNPSVDPRDYYREALKRDPGDTRCNIAMGIDANKRGMHADAERYLRRALERISDGYTRPRDGEPLYQLGLALRAVGRPDEAVDCFHRAAWDQGVHSAAMVQLAELACMRGDFAEALNRIDAALATNAADTRARGIKAMILRKLHRPEEASRTAAGVLAEDPLDFLSTNERYLAALEMRDDSAPGLLSELNRHMRGEVQSHLELAADYMSCGQWADAVAVLQRPVDAKLPFAATYPLLHYYLGYLQEHVGDTERAAWDYANAAKMPSDYCFPFRLESADVLRAAIARNPDDPKAHYYLGNLLYELQPDEAIACWQRSVERDDSFALAQRNLGWGLYRARGEVDAAIAAYERAVADDPDDPRLYFELDTLYEIGNVDPHKRLDLLLAHHDVVKRYQESLIREIMALVLVGRYEQAIDLLSHNRFHAREGVDRIGGVYADAYLLRGIASLNAGKPDDALADFPAANAFPDNLALGKASDGYRVPQVSYYLGLASAAKGDTEAARAHFAAIADRASVGSRPESRYYHALCMKQLGRDAAAEKIFDELIAGASSLADPEEDEFFAKFGERDSKRIRDAAAHYAVALGLIGKGRKAEAKKELDEAIRLNRSHVWANYLRSTL